MAETIEMGEVALLEIDRAAVIVAATVVDVSVVIEVAEAESAVEIEEEIDVVVVRDAPIVMGLDSRAFSDISVHEIERAVGGVSLQLLFIFRYNKLPQTRYRIEKDRGVWRKYRHSMYYRLAYEHSIKRIPVILW